MSFLKMMVALLVFSSVHPICKTPIFAKKINMNGKLEGNKSLVVLACEVGGRWAAECGELIRDLLRVWAPRAQALRHASRAGWERRWWGMLNCAQQTAVASTLLGNAWRSPFKSFGDEGPQLSAVLQLAAPEEPSRLPLQS